MLARRDAFDAPDPVEEQWAAVARHFAASIQTAVSGGGTAPISSAQASLPASLAGASTAPP
jgi:hypothetical protein